MKIKREDPYKPYYGYRKRVYIQWIILLLIISCVVGYIYLKKQYIFAVLVDNQIVGYVKSKKDVEEAKNEVIKDMLSSAGNPNARIKQSVKIERQLNGSKKLLAKGDLKLLFSEKLTVEVPSFGIFVNDSPKAFLPSFREANEVLETIKEMFTPKVGEVVYLSFIEKVEIKEIWTSPQEVITKQEAINSLIGNSNNQYIVCKGDTFLTIAKKYNIEVSELKKLNPGIDVKKLSIGQRLNISRKKSIITVEAQVKKTEKVKIPYMTIVQKNNKMFADEVKVENQGEEGEKLITFKITFRQGNEYSKDIIEEKILKQPVTKRVIQGTKIREIKKHSR